MGIRVATPDDAKAILSIYAPFCQPASAVSFETLPPTQEDMHKRIFVTLKTYPWLVWEQNGAIVGYAYADQHKSRAAYNWDVDVFIYMNESVRGKGIGKKLYHAMFEGLKTLGYYNAYAAISLPNEAALALHKSMGFTLIGVFHNVGFKGGAWRDVAWFALKLQPYMIDPPQPIKFSALGV